VRTGWERVDDTDRVEHADTLLGPWDRIRLSATENFSIIDAVANRRKSNLLVSERLVDRWAGFVGENRTALRSVEAGRLGDRSPTRRRRVGRDLPQAADRIAALGDPPGSVCVARPERPVGSPADDLRARVATEQPAAASCMTSWRPIPEPPPVTTAVLRSNDSTATYHMSGRPSCCYPALAIRAYCQATAVVRYTDHHQSSRSATTCRFAKVRFRSACSYRRS
jgi:hypothetical protein